MVLFVHLRSRLVFFNVCNVVCSPLSTTMEGLFQSSTKAAFEDETFGFCLCQPFMNIRMMYNSHSSYEIV